MGASSDRQRIATYYDRLVDRYGYDPRACDASGLVALKTRYEVLSQVTDLTGKSVLEVGCGFGDLGAYILAKYHRVEYVGIDVSPRMIQEGRKVRPGLTLRVMDVVEMPQSEKYDVVLAQGVFYLLEKNAQSETRRLIKKMFGLAREALAFCALSTWGPAGDSSEYRVDPMALLQDCRRLTTCLQLRHDYLPHDVALYLYRQQPA